MLSDSELSALDQAWKTINSIGGYAAPGDAVGAETNRVVGLALDVIERLGGMDPLLRQPSHDPRSSLTLADALYLAALRAAGVEVEDDGEEPKP